MNNELLKALQLQNQISVYRDELYISTIQKIQEESASILKPNLGSTFVKNCARDIAGEVVRNYFDTSDYNITVDQMAMRILKFNYNDEYDPLSRNTEVQKNVYNYNDITSSTLNDINADLDRNQEKLFTKLEGSSYYEDQYLIDKNKKVYREENKVKSSNSLAFDEYTGNKERQTQDSRGSIRSDLDIDHTQDLDGASYNSKLIKEKGIDELKRFYNSSKNFSTMSDVANRAKNAIKVYDKQGNDITHRATPDQLTAAVCKKWENSSNPDTIQKLKDKGYLNENGKVPKSIKDKLRDNYITSQNAESKVILKNTDYGGVAKDSAKYIKAGIGKVIIGQVIYYAAPPIVYEVRNIVSDRKIKLNNAMERLAEAGGRICNYVFSHLKDIFKNITENSLKKFIKSFMDILIGMVKATVKKLLKIVKTVVMSVVDSIKIIVTPGSTAGQKSDAVFNLFGVTITNIILELLFEAVENGLGIPEFLLAPLQILTSVICTNLIMLVLEKADLFNVRFGFQMTALEEMFERERNNYNDQMDAYNQATQEEITQLLDKVKLDCQRICDSLKTFDPYEDSARGILEDISRIFNMNIDFESEWQHFLERPTIELGA